MGAVELPEECVSMYWLRQCIRKLVDDGEYRRRFLRPLAFPVERHYASGDPLPVERRRGRPLPCLCAAYSARN